MTEAVEDRVEVTVRLVRNEAFKDHDTTLTRTYSASGLTDHDMQRDLLDVIEKVVEEALGRWVVEWPEYHSHLEEFKRTNNESR